MELSLKDILNGLKKKKFVDLTHAFEPDIPHFHGVGTMGHGFLAEKYSIVGQWGTHVDPPSHFHRGMRPVDQIKLEEMVLELVVIDISEKVKKNDDYAVQMEDILEWEKKYKKKIPENSFVALRSDWSLRWPDEKKTQNKKEDGLFHWPGWSMKVLEFLCKERNITAIGHESTDTDPGMSVSKGNFECESYILKQNKYQIEVMDNLRSCPCEGAIVFVTFPKPKNGSGFPARVFAVKD